MASQHANAELCLGDSHVYQNLNESIDPYINAIILRELQKLTRPEFLTASEQWISRYAKSFKSCKSTYQINDHTDLFFPNGGIGMTLSLALAEEYFAAKK